MWLRICFRSVQSPCRLLILAADDWLEFEQKNDLLYGNSVVQEGD
jgi:hypothetical protein